MATELPQVNIYTDGACKGNPGPGGYGTLLIYKGHQRELSGGFRKTTNNRMEILAVIEGLKALKFPCAVTVYSDSKYVVDAMEQGWVKRWQKNGWKRNKNEPALNPDLWAEMLNLCSQHQVKFSWVKGHAGHVENEYCDQLAVAASLQYDLPPDVMYEKTVG
ncbi:MAG: ribonuclease HI [Microcoleaceae cyanobacterium]